MPENRTPAAPARQDAVETVSFVSLGCPKNLVDSEKMLGLLAEDGLLPVPPDEPADAVVINTCGFLEASKDESLEEIRQAAEAKRQGVVQRVVVAGCLVQRHRAKLLEWCPDIDALIGVFDRDRIVEAVRGPAAGERAGEDLATDLPVYASIAGSAAVAKRDRGIALPGYHEDDAARLRLTPRHYAYLRMSEGCNQNCAFCTIPSIRGKMRSKPVERIASEMRELMSDGAFEINLIGQDTTSFGRDLGYEPGLVGLLETLDGVAREFGGGWLRLMYAYPTQFEEAMIDAIARLPHVTKYIDIPLQHISTQVLDRMRRRTSRELIETLLTKLRQRVPGIAIRTTFISGFPGETDAQHRELVDFVRAFGFDNLGVFGFSPEPGTPSAKMHAESPVPPEVIEERVEEIMLTQQEVVFDRNAELAAEQPELDVLIDGATTNTLDIGPSDEPIGRLHTGRSYAQAPQVDALTFVQSRSDLAAGELVRCRIVDCDGYDLVARPVAELERSQSLNVLR
ncbi:MAG: 30S ribosomal protein S12 methylthiotransferase RimO [Phycisphaeraceae bacterium]